MDPMHPVLMSVLLIFACLASSCAFQSFNFMPSTFVNQRSLLSPLSFCKEFKLRARTQTSVKMVVSELIGDFNVGDRVRVIQNSITLFTVKDHPDGYQVPKGAEGEIVKVITVDVKSGKPVSPNRPLLVKFNNPKFQAHFEARELEKAL